MSVSIRDLDTTTSDFEEGDLEDVVAVDDGLELENNPALEFDGIDDYVELDSLITLNDNFEITLNMKLDSDGDFTSSGQMFLSEDGIKSTFIRVINDDDIQVATEDDNTRMEWTDTGVDFKGKWVDFKLTKTNGDYELFLNGISHGTETDNNSLTIDTIGSGWDDDNYHTEGILDNLTIKENDNIIHEYKMFEGSGSTIEDSVGSNDGTIYGANWTTNTDRYLTEGTRQSPQINISSVGNIDNSLIKWLGSLYYLKADSPEDGSITLEKQVDLTDIETLYIDWDASDGEGNQPNTTFGIDKDSETIRRNNGEHYWYSGRNTDEGDSDVGGKFERMITELNVSDYTDMYYIGFNLETSSSAEQKARLEVFEIWGEDDENNKTNYYSFQEGYQSGNGRYTEPITIETSIDGGDTWDTCTNGDPIPNIDGASTLDIKQTLETNDTTVTPVLESLTVDIDTADSNDDSGGFSATLDENFQVVQTDEGVFTSQEDNDSLKIAPQEDSGSFYKDAENWETFIFEVVLDEDKLTSSIDFDTFHNWARKPIKDEVWNKQDSPTSQWIKKDRPSTDWQKED